MAGGVGGGEGREEGKRATEKVYPCHVLRKVVYACYHVRDISSSDMYLVSYVRLDAMSISSP